MRRIDGLQLRGKHLNILLAIINEKTGPFMTKGPVSMTSAAAAVVGLRLR
jgi:hypothetical protein